MKDERKNFLFILPPSAFILTKMPVTDMSLFLIFGFLLLAAYVGGGIIAWVLSWEARRDRAELRQERQTLIEENRRLSDEILQLKEQIIDLRSQLATAVQELNRFTAVLDGRENLNN